MKIYNARINNQESYFSKRKCNEIKLGKTVDIVATEVFIICVL